MRLALHQPDQAGNVGTILRLAACLGVPVDLVEPCGFPFSDRALKRAGMDYAEMAAVARHSGWEAFEAAAAGAARPFTTAPAPSPCPKPASSRTTPCSWAPKAVALRRRCTSGRSSGCVSPRRRALARSTSPWRRGSGLRRRFGRRGYGLRPRANPHSSGIGPSIPPPDLPGELEKPRRASKRVTVYIFEAAWAAFGRDKCILSLFIPVRHRREKFVRTKGHEGH